MWCDLLSRNVAPPSVGGTLPAYLLDPEISRCLNRSPDLPRLYSENHLLSKISLHIAVDYSKRNQKKSFSCNLILLYSIFKTLWKFRVFKNYIVKTISDLQKSCNMQITLYPHPDFPDIYNCVYPLFSAHTYMHASTHTYICNAYMFFLNHLRVNYRHETLLSLNTWW